MVVSSAYGILDFYDKTTTKQWINNEDALYDLSGNCLGFLRVFSDIEWFWERKNLFQRSNRIEIFSQDEELLAIADTEKSEECFAFRDAEDAKIIALAFLHRFPIEKWNYCRQEWEVIVVDPARMEKLSHLFLIWVLLKHSQKKTFPNPADFPYMVAPEKVPST